MPKKKNGKRKKKRDPAAPKKPLSAFMFFSKRNRAEMKEQNPQLSFGQLGQLMGQKWKELTDAEKKPYEALNEKDKIRYQNEMKDYTPPPDEEGSRKRRKGGPKKTRSAYLFFQQEILPELKRSQPLLKFGDVAKEIGKRWKELPDDQKAPYIAKQDTDKQRYASELEEWTKNNPPSPPRAKPPKKPLSAFMYFSKQNRAQVKAKNPDASFGALGKIMGDQWKSLSEAEKKKYEDLNAQDKIRYEEEMKDYVPPPDLEDSKKKKKRGPKKTRSAYLFFQQDVLPELKSQYPNMKFGDVAKEIGKRWKLLNDQQKAPYMAKQDADKQRYLRELDEWQSNQDSSSDDSDSSGSDSDSSDDDSDDEE